MSGQRWLWISAEVNEKLATGLLVYSAGLSGALATAGVRITMIGIGPESTKRQGIDLRPVAGELQGGWKSLASTLPNLSYACRTEPMVEAAKTLISQGGWDAIVFDHLQVAWAFDLVPETDQTPTVFVTHNHETSMRKEVAAELPIWTPRGLALRFDAVKAGRLEHQVLKRASVVTSITEADQRQFETAAPSARHVLAKPGWSGSIPDEVPPLADRPRRVGIIGSFEWHVKQENLLRFVRLAGPELLRSNIELAVAGNVPNGFRERLQAESDVVNCIGWVDSVADFLGECRIGVVAEPLGGGFKLKSLDYVALRVPIAATAGSLEGLPLVGGESVIEAPTEQELGRKMSELIDQFDYLEGLAAVAFSSCSPTLRWEEQVTSLTQAVSVTH